MSRACPLLLMMVLLLAGCGQPAEQVGRCQRRADCQPGYTCEPLEGRCVDERECDTQADCCPGLTCLGGACRRLVVCDDPADCAAGGGTCDDGICLAVACATNADCGPPARCLNGACATWPLCGGCKAGAVCEPRTGRCVQAPGCDPASCEPGTVALAGNLDELRNRSMSCTPDHVTCACATLPEVEAPRLGSWLGAGWLGDTLVAVGRDASRGDLVAAVVNPAALGPVVALDGVPSGPVVGDPSGPRGGVDASGSSAGHHVAVATVGERLAVLSHDATHGSLRFAEIALDSGGRPEAVVEPMDLDPERDSGMGASLASDGAALHAAWFTLRPDGALSLRYANRPPGGSDQAWERTIVMAEAPPVGPPTCPDGCGVLGGACVRGDDGPECATPDLVPRCDPACDRGSLCVQQVCREQLRADHGTRPWRDRPGSETAVATFGGAALLAWYDHRSGALHLVADATDPSAGPGRLDGGDGADIGRHPRLAVAADGTLALAYADSSRGVLRLLHGPAADALAPTEVGAGGRGIALDTTAAGELVLAHGAADGSRVNVLIGLPGAWKTQEITGDGHVGRFNAVVANDLDAVLLTVADRLDPVSLRPQPAVLTAVLSL